jgi:DNA-binding LacI/PurR family transcriptional regulator
VDIRERAKRASVSAATVSRATHGDPDRRPVLAARVWRVVGDIGAQSLVSGKSIIPAAMSPETNHLSLASVIENFQLVAETFNYDLSATGYDVRRM